MNVLLIFVDGLGVGTRDAHNPLSLHEAHVAPLAVFAGEPTRTIFNGVCCLTDARLGVEGRPQSASGQTTILTGINAALALGFHKQGFPNQALRDIIQEHSIFLQLQRCGIAPNVFANAYPPSFFNKRPRWVAATTVAVEAAGMNFLTFGELCKGDALIHDFTNELAPETLARLQIADGTLERRTPEQAAQILASITVRHRFTLYEYFLTDRAGHAQDFSQAERVLIQLSSFVRHVLRAVDLHKTTVILTSDHGNIEDLSVRTHTLNPVPTLAWGAGCELVARRVSSLTDITPTIIELLTQFKENITDETNAAERSITHATV